VSGGHIKPTHLLSKSNLSYAMMNEYLALLKERGLVTEQVGERKEYLITDKGLNYLAEYRRMATFTEAFGL